MSDLVAEVREAMSLPDPDAARAIREAAQVSRARLGAELGVGELAVYRWETGKRSPRGNTRLAYARLLRDLDGAARNPRQLPDSAA
jgi:DNA-binding transcriptional regulator YiaG